MLLDIQYIPTHRGYFAGTQDGIVTAGGKPAHGNIHIFDANSLLHIAGTRSLANGHYLIPYLDPARAYLILARHPLRHYDPVSYDNVKPAHNLTLREQADLWQSWL